MDDFVSLTQTLKDWFNKPLTELPKNLQALVLSRYFNPPEGFPEELLYLHTPLDWDEMGPNSRRVFAERFDDLFDPAKRKIRKAVDKKMREVDVKIKQWDATAVPTALDLAAKLHHLKTLADEKANLNNQERHALAGEQSALNFLGIEHSMPTLKSGNSDCQSVDAKTIRRTFKALPDPDKNDDWWKEMMRDAKRNGLDGCRVGEGKPGKVGKGGTTWRPDLIAGWLADRHGKKLTGCVPPNRVGAMLKKISGYEEIAESMFPADE